MLLVIVEGAPERSYCLPEKAGAVVIGRLEGTNVWIPHPSVSRRHALVHVGPESVTIEDLGSLNGTFVKSERLEPHRPRRLASGEVVRVGDVVLVLRDEVAPEQRGFGSETRIGKAPDRGASPGVVVASDPMRRVYDVVDRVAPGTISVLLLGETGVGKQVLAQAVHARSRRAAKPFVSLSCVAFPEALLEAELFGHEKGAFTGADQAKPGLLESAEGGTLFLDEIGEVPLGTQAKLLRVLEERQVLRLGAVKPRALDVRFVTATNRDLEAEVAAGRFRKDLYYRLNGVTVQVPSLRERREEIALLARHFLSVFCRQLGRAAAPELTPAALELMERYPWPGNVRELRNVVERAVLLSGDGPIDASHLAIRAPAAVQVGSATERLAAVAPDRPTMRTVPDQKLREVIGTIERERIVAALEECHGNQTHAARKLGLSRSAFLAKLDLYGISRPRKRLASRDEAGE